MKDINEKKIELEERIKNSIWESSEHGLTYKFQNESDLWINGNAHFSYNIGIAQDKLVLSFFPNGKEFFIELKFGEVLFLQDSRQNFTLTFKSKV